MKRFWLSGNLAVLAILLLTPGVRANDGAVVLARSGENIQLKVDGDKDDEWWIETSTDLAHWTTLANFGTILSGNETNAPWRSAGPYTNAMLHYRARQTEGLYDPAVLRTISLTFTQANWSNLLVKARQNETYVYGSLLTVNNGATNVGIGARFRGNTSFTGMGGGGPGGGGGTPAKKSLAIAIDYSLAGANLMNYDQLNLNNAYGDETIMREPVYFTIMRHYTVCPAGCLVQLYINGANRGVYSQAQQQDGDLIREYFPSGHGDRWRAPNMDEKGAFVYLGNTNLATYKPYYALKSDENTNAWPRLINAIYVFNKLAADVLRDQAEDVVAVDRWLWFLALENIFADDDSYWNKGSDYMLYFEPESGRFHPVEHDGNESFVAGDVRLSPLVNLTSANRPLIKRLLGNAELRQRYFAHMRTVLEEWFNPTNALALVNQFHRLSADAIAADPCKGYTTMSTYTNDLNALRSFITNRWLYLTTCAELKPLPPIIAAVHKPTTNRAAGQVPFVTAEVAANDTNGLDSVWLYHRGKDYGKFSYAQMLDDGAHGDGAAGDGVFGAATTNYPAGSKVEFYVEACSANAAKAAVFSPPRAEQEAYSYRVTLAIASNTPVVINEFMADNESAYADPQGKYDDWIELRNLTDQPVSLTGHYLSNASDKPRHWQFPDGTTIPANGYLIVWADEDGSDTPGLHANFKLSKDGEQIYLLDTDANFNAVLDSIAFGTQTTNRSYGRSAGNADVWTFMIPTPGAAN